MAPVILCQDFDLKSFHSTTSSKSTSSSTTSESESPASSMLDDDDDLLQPEDDTANQKADLGTLLASATHVVESRCLDSGRSAQTPQNETIMSHPEEVEQQQPARIKRPSLEDGSITDTFMRDLIEFYKHQERLGSVMVTKVLMDAKKVLMTYPALVDVELTPNDTLNVCGDIHGQFYDLANIFDKFGFPSATNQYLFNGDFVDRGPWSVEVMIVLLGFKILYPDHFFLGRGNHEAEEVNKLYGFHNEVLSKYDTEMFCRFQLVFNWLPLAHCINKQILVAHGGLPSQESVSLDDIRQLPRGIQPPKQGIMCDLLWADPQDQEGIAPNSRGYACLFGPDVTEKFLRLNRLTYLIRSHECVPYGYDLCHDDKVVTIFSAPNYCDRYGNKGAVCILHGDDVTMPEFRKFEAVPHPQVEAMKYASIFMKLGMI